MTIERGFDVAFVAGLALREKQIQQNYRPIIAVHKWFARRPGTLFRALLLAEFGSGPLRERFFEANSLRGLRIADPFMGGGTPLFEANRLGCDVFGYDINPMAHWIVRQEIESLDLAAYQEAAAGLTRSLEGEIDHLYRTRCTLCGSSSAAVKYFLWVKTLPCGECGRVIDLFPGYLVAENRRHPRNVFTCAACGELTETDDRTNPGACASCGAALAVVGPARGNRCQCPTCQAENRYPDPSRGAPRHRLFAIEYHCPACKRGHRGRFFKKADAADLAKYDEAITAWRALRPSFVPADEIPAGDETDRLHRWGYRRYREMFNERQLLGLEMSARLIARQRNTRIRNALATNLSDLLRYQNMLCRYDTMALKSLDIFSIHGFPVGLVQCESNLLGIIGGSGATDLFGEPEGGVNIGSGGWANIIDKYAKAKAYCARPFEIRYEGRCKVQVPVPGEWIGDVRLDKPTTEPRQVVLHCQSATAADLPPASLDAVLTDPPYFGNVQYAELMDFCYVWLRRLAGRRDEAFRPSSTRSANELTGNATMERGIEHFTEGLAQVFRRMAAALKPGGPLAFTYHHNTLDAYYPVAVAILDAGLVCTASLPCPAEMAASIHINGTGSSIVDTVFVCRSAAALTGPLAAPPPGKVAALVREDMSRLRAGGVEATQGDMRCILFGHLIRLAVWNLHQTWEADWGIAERLAAIAAWLDWFRAAESAEAELGLEPSQAPAPRRKGKSSAERGGRDAPVAL